MRGKGYADYLKHLDVMRAQNLSDLDHAYVIVIRSEFEDGRGKARSAMGCGFSSESYRAAELDAVRDLQAYFWGWKPDLHGYADGAQISVLSIVPSTFDRLCGTILYPQARTLFGCFASEHGPLGPISTGRFDICRLNNIDISQREY